MDPESKSILYEKPIVKEEPAVTGTAIHYQLYYPPQHSTVELKQAVAQVKV
jgi:hypothetical protein